MSKLCLPIIYKIKLNIHYILLTIVLAVGLFININNLEYKYPVGDGDVSRDYLIASHIVEYGELPTLGPWNSIYGPLRNSPLYFYVLASFLFFHNNILFLGVINILLQSIAALLIFLMAKKLFSSSTGLISATLFIFSSATAGQFSFVWQPHIMFPFLQVSFLFYIVAFERKSFQWLFVSIFMYIFSAALHYSVLSTIPLAVFFVAIFLYKFRRNVNYYLSTGLFSIILFLLFYFPVFIHLIVSKNIAFVTTEEVYVKTLQEFIIHFYTNLITLFNLFSINVLLLPIIILCFSFYFISPKIQKNNKIAIIILLIFVLQPIVFSSFLHTFVYYHYFTPIFGLFLILLAEIIHKIFSESLLIFKVLVIIFLLTLSFYNKEFFMWSTYHDLNIKNVSAASETIQKELTMPSSNMKNYFQIALSKKGDGLTASDSVFWVQLEKRLGTKFVKIVNEKNNYEPINNDLYVFLICEHYDETDEQRECLSPFLAGDDNTPFYKQYILIKKIYSQKPYSIYLTLRSE